MRDIHFTSLFSSNRYIARKFKLAWCLIWLMRLALMAAGIIVGVWAMRVGIDVLILLLQDFVDYIAASII